MILSFFIDNDCFCLFNANFLYCLNECSFRNLLYFLMSETVFWIFFFVCRKRKTEFSSYVIENEEIVCRRFFYIAFLLYLVCTIFTYVFVGIPLFANSRQNIYENAFPGMAIFAKLSSFGLSYILFYSFYQVLEYKKKLYMICFVFALLTCLLSGSKGSILAVLYSYFGYKYFFKNEEVKVSLKYYLLIVFSRLGFCCCLLNRMLRMCLLHLQSYWLDLLRMVIRIIWHILMMLLILYIILSHFLICSLVF